MEIVTGFKGAAHITAAQDGAFNAGVFGSESYVLENGKQLEATVITNNLIRIHDGDIVMQGRHVTIAAAQYEELQISNGLSGMNRNDLIVCRYTRESTTGIENAELVVIQGTSTENEAQDPKYTTGDILAGDLIADMPLYRIKLTGLNVAEPEKLFQVVPTINALNNALSQKAASTELSKYLKLSGGTMTGTIYSNAVTFLQSIYGDYGLIFRKDGSAFYMLLTDSENSKGNYNNLRPFMINLQNGDVSLGHSLNVTGAITTQDSVYINGASGLIFSNYGGGWYMGDDTWINAVNNKNIFTNGIIKAGTQIETPGIELYHSTSWIDFHKDNNTEDFTSRLVENIAGSLYLYANRGNDWGWFHAAGYTVESSKHVKTNIENMTDEEALKLLDLRVVSFDYKNGTKDKRGLIAEEAYKILPQIVQMPEDYDEDTFEYKEGEFNNTPSIDYGSITPYLIKLIQLQQKQIDGLKEKLDVLENKLTQANIE